MNEKPVAKTNKSVWEVVAYRKDGHGEPILVRVLSESAERATMIATMRLTERVKGLTEATLDEYEVEARPFRR